MLELFQQKKQNLFEIYEKIKEENELLPVGDITAKSIDERKKNLDDAEFVLAVAGQIKAGKSTMLNALIFQKDILPVDDTPHTAKITEIRYADEAFAQIIFYTQEEWQNIKNSDYYKEHLAEDVELASRDGVFAKEILGEIRKVKLEELSGYVAKNGKFAPFVKLAKVYYPNDILKDLVVVDTPGINDSNIYRSKVTHQWIQNADAVIYATYAGRTLDKNDTDFIDEYLVHVERDKLIVAITKIDTADDVKKLEDWIAEVKKDNKKIFNDYTAFEYVSQLGELCRVCDEQPANTGANLQKLEMNGWLDEQKNGFVSLRKTIGEKLQQNKGDAIITSHKKFITTLFDRKKSELETKKESIKSDIVDFSKTKDELEKERQSLEKIIKKMANIFDEFKNNLRDIEGRAKQKSEKNLYEIKQKMVETINRKTRQIGNTSNFGNDYPWIVKDVIESKKDDIYKEIDANKTKYLENLKEEISKISEKMGEEHIFNPNTLLKHLNFSAFDILSKLEEKIGSEYLAGNMIQSIVEESTHFWQRWFDTEGGLDKIYSSLSDQTNTVFEDFFTKLKIEIFTAMPKARNELETAIETKLNDEIDAKKKKIDDILSNKIDTEDEIAKREVELGEVEKQKQKFENSQKEYDSLLKKEV